MGAMRQVFLDTETTGLSAEQGDRVIEIGCIEFDNRRETGRRLHHYLNPQRASHPDALRVHGLTEEFLADKPLFAQVADELVGFIQGAEVVIHNAAFDLSFLDAELSRLGRGRFAAHAGRITDSLAMAREMFPGKANSLDALCRRLEVDNSKRDLHGALLDAGLLAEVYLRMTRGQRSLAIDSEGAGAGWLADAGADLTRLVLPEWPADADERREHARVMADLDQACRGKAVWRDEAAA